MTAQYASLDAYCALIDAPYCAIWRILTICRLVPVLDQLNAAVHAFTGPLSICQYWPITVMFAGLFTSRWNTEIIPVTKDPSYFWNENDI